LPAGDGPHPGDFPTAGVHVREHNNLAQKNLTIVDLLPNDFIVVAFAVPNTFPRAAGEFNLHLVPHQPFIDGTASLIRSEEVARFATLFPAREELPFSKKDALKIPVNVRPTEQHAYGRKLTAPFHTAGHVLKYDLTQMDRRTDRVVGGIAIELRVQERR
jgi:hypothetical protein